MRALVYFLALPTVVVAQAWTPYRSHYTITTTVRNAQGSILQKISKDMHEIRENDGSTVTNEEVSGRTVSTVIRLACGDFVSLNYSKKTASITNFPGSIAQHFQPPPNDPPIGTATIAGLKVTGWPAHTQNGTAAMWFDVKNDILVKTEAHIKNPNGIVIDEIRELKAIDLMSPVDPSATKLPPGFVMDSGSKAPCDPTIIP